MARWRSTIQVGRWALDEEMPFKERRDGIAGALEAWVAEHSAFVRRVDPDGELELAISNVKDAKDPDDFDSLMADVYDWADTHRIWIEAHRIPEGSA